MLRIIIFIRLLFHLHFLDHNWGFYHCLMSVQRGRNRWLINLITIKINVNMATKMTVKVIKTSNKSAPYWFQNGNSQTCIEHILFYIWDHFLIFFFLLNSLKTIKAKQKARLPELINAFTSTALWWRAEDLYGTLSNIFSLDSMLGPSALGADGMKPSQQSTLSEIKLLTLLQEGNGKEGQHSLSGN